MNIQEENSALYFRVQSEREKTLVSQIHALDTKRPVGSNGKRDLLRICHLLTILQV